MHPILLEYGQRFKKNNHQTPEINTKLSAFYTSLDHNFEDDLPYLYDIEIACNRLILALKNQDKICIYSDYDTDAVTATATMYWGLVLLGFEPDNIDFYAPDRFTEGYGMNTEAVKQLCEKYKLIISVDCGINSILEAEICRTKQVDLIITDHHHLSGDIPKALAVINPRLSQIFEDPNNIHSRHKIDKKSYLSASVTGVGVAWFVLVWLAYYLKNDSELKNDFEIKDLNQLLGFVAVGTIADCQSILEETNRLLVKSGLKMIQYLCQQAKTNQILTGLWLLLDQAGLRNRVSNGYKIVSSDLGFTLSPILNSSGRLSHASHSIEVLLSGKYDSDKASILVSSLIATNNQRKSDVARILSEVEFEAKIQFEEGKNLIWVANSSWSKGLIGLLASRLVNQFGLPVVVVELPEGESTESDQNMHSNSNRDLSHSSHQLCTASLRAPEGYILPLAMKNQSELFEKFGGHPGAAGFTAKLENLKKIQDLLNKELSQQALNLNNLNKIDYSFDESKQLITQFKLDHRSEKTDTIAKIETLSTKINTLWINQEGLNDLTFWQSLLEMEPFGQDFLYPILIFPYKIGKYTTISENKHLKFEFNDNPDLSMIWFNYAKDGFDLSQMSQGSNTLVVGRAQQNAWKNKLSWQIVIEDVLIL